MKRVIGLVVHNWPLKLAALALSFLLYAGLVVSQSQFDYTSPVPIKPVNVPANTVPLGNLPPVTRIRYIVNGDVGAGPTPDTWRATVDLSGVDPSAGSSIQTVSVTSVDPRFIVIDYEPRSVNVELDPYTSYTVPVTVDTGTPPEGLEVGTPVLSTETAVVAGPDSVVKYVVAVQADVAIDPHGLSVDREVPLIPVDNLGNELRPVNVNPKTVRVQITVLSNAQSKSLPVKPNVTGTPPSGYELGPVTVDPPTVTVRGDPQALSPLTKADTEPIPVGTSTGTISADVKLALPPGVVGIDVTTVHVTVEIRPVTGTRTFEAALVLAGRQSGYEYALSTGSVQVVLGGPIVDLDRIDPANFTITLDVAGLGPGVHELQPVPNVQAGLKVNSVDPSTVTVTITSAAPSPSAPPSVTP
ncbi:MAG TPA: CdaR family protein [Candidatus Limnocylindrales bacterium]